MLARSLSISRLSASLKQYAMLALPAAWASGRLRLRDLVVGLVAGALIVLPFVLWDPKAFLLGTVGFHIHSPFRPDCLSVPAAVAVTTGRELPAALGFVAAGGVAGVLLWRQGPGLGNIGLGGAAVFGFLDSNRARFAASLADATNRIQTITQAGFSDANVRQLLQRLGVPGLELRLGGVLRAIFTEVPPSRLVGLIRPILDALKGRVVALIDAILAPLKAAIASARGALDGPGAVQRVHRAVRDAGCRAVPVPQRADLLAVLHPREVL